jgi:hypothetical protein
VSIATAEELWKEAAGIVQDPSYEWGDYLKLFNDCLKQVSGSLLLPELETDYDIVVGTGSITADTISFIATTKTIADSDSGLISAGFHVGQTITVTGAGDPTNNQTTTITSIASTGASMIVAGTLADESAGEEISIVNDGPGYVPLPSNYHRNLYSCRSITNFCPITVYQNLRLLLRNFSYPDQNGRVLGVAIRGSNLHYQRIPSATEILRLYFYEKITEMTKLTDQPLCIPEGYEKPLLINYACKEIYNLIEDGVEGSKVNTNTHTNLYQGAYNELAQFIGEEGKEPGEIPDETNLEALLHG